MHFIFIIFLHLTFSQDLNSPLIHFDCKHLVLPYLCQCYHSGDESQLRCHNIQLRNLPKLPNNMRWNALDFSVNHLIAIESYVFSDIYVGKLDLKFNYIETIDLTAFTDIQNLRELYLNQNRLKEFDPKSLISPGTSLEIFDISNNPLGYLNLSEIFYHVPALREFHAVSCQLTDLSLLTYANSTRHHHYALELLDLSSNNLTSLCNDFFNHFYNLIELRLINNQIYAIDNRFISSLTTLKILNLALNSIEQVPKLISLSLEIFNLSSNNIHNLTDSFAEHLSSIRTIDFDSNKYFNTISLHAFCSMNLTNLEKLSFRSTDILSLNIFSTILCRLNELTHDLQEPILDLNENIHLKCDCLLVQYEKYLINYRDLTCTQEGQDRYFISNVKYLFLNCSSDICLNMPRYDSCLQMKYQLNSSKDVCREKQYLEEKNRTFFRTITTTITTTMKMKVKQNLVENLTNWYPWKRISRAKSMKTIDFSWFFIGFFTFHSFGEINFFF